MLGRPDSGRCLSRRRIPVSADEESRRLAFVRERAVRDELTLLKEAEERGIEKGIEKGRTEGEAFSLQLLLKHRFGDIPSERLGQIAAASPEQLSRWLIQAIDAASLDDVFRD